jgi:hypothetical protein
MGRENYFQKIYEPALAKFHTYEPNAKLRLEVLKRYYDGLGPEPEVNSSPQKEGTLVKALTEPNSSGSPHSKRRC